MAKKIDKNPNDIHNPFSSYTHCVEVVNSGKVLFCSGQIPARQDRPLLDPDYFAAQGKWVI